MTFMRRFSIFCLFLTCCACSYSILPPLPSLGEDLEVKLQDAEYGNGTISTDKGGIVTAKDLYLQAQHIEYTRNMDADPAVHTISGIGKLFVTYKGRSYRGEKGLIDLVQGKITIWNGCTQTDNYFLGGKVIEISSDGKGEITDAYVTTSENERNEWSIGAKHATIENNSKIHANGVSFYFVKIPLFYLPSFSTDLLEMEDGTPFRYRARWGGREGVRLGMSYILKTEQWRHRALLDYSLRLGLGGGVRSLFSSATGPAKFESLNYVAQGTDKSWDSMRYRFQGFYTTELTNPDFHVRGMYDKLSDRRMKYDFSEHAISDARAGLTQITLWKGREDWKASLNGRVRINTFQTVKQELPLLDFNTRPQPLGDSRLILDNKISAGYLNYRYANHTPSVHDFASTRNEISQKLYTNALASPFLLTPSIGYRVIQYSNSPQDHNRLQAFAEIGLGMKTRFVNSSLMGDQIVEPYAEWTTVTRPPVQTKRVYIFDSEDGWAKMNCLQYGARHNWFLSSGNSTFQPKIISDVFLKSFYKTRYLPKDPYKLWLVSTFDATPTVAYKLAGGWDIKRRMLDHLNVAMRKTVSKNLAFILEWRQRSSYSWRKVDSQNFMVEAVRSTHELRHSQMSDNRQTSIFSIVYSPTPVLDIDLSTFYGIRRTNPKRYVNYELNIQTLIRGGLRIIFTFQHRPGGPTNGFYISFALGPKKVSDTTTFRKIGDGNYDLW